LVVFASAPITQIIYGYLLMNALNPSPLGGIKLLSLGIFSGLALGASAFVQSSVSAAGADAYAETEQGFVNYILVYGLIESMALFIMVFTTLIAGG
jgi:V/A-type H+-transporting ATPase subunit K